MGGENDRGHPMTRRTVVAAVLVTALASPVVTAWLVGDQSCECPDRKLPLDTMYDAPHVSHATAVGVVVASVVALGVALGIVGVGLLRTVVTLDDVRFAVPLVLGGIYAGMAFRVVTAGVVGANIGGGMVFSATPFIMLGLAAWTVRWRPHSPNAEDPTPT